MCHHCLDQPRRVSQALPFSDWNPSVPPRFNLSEFFEPIFVLYSSFCCHLVSHLELITVSLS